MDGKKCSSAVFTALQIGQLNISEIERVIKSRFINSFLCGADFTEWIDTFWSNVGLVVAAEAAMIIKAREGGE